MHSFVRLSIVQINQKVLVRILNKLGIDQVQVVDNGQKAVDMEATEQFDVILMDMQVSKYSCMQLCI